MIGLSAFNSFKNNYLVVYSLMMAGDWLQGPYVYYLYLYSQYGFSKGEISRLFIAGFGSSMLFGTVVGSLANKKGRKRACVTYYITYILSCITKHSPEYKVLMVGRILGGITTSLLFSAFESWLVAEHNKSNCMHNLRQLKQKNEFEEDSQSFRNQSQHFPDRNKPVKIAAELSHWKARAKNKSRRSYIFGQIPDSSTGMTGLVESVKTGT